jgi:hypothetical protein
MITRAITWTSAVQTAYKATQNHLRLFEGDHGAVFLANGTRLPFELVIPNLLGECLTEPLADLMFPDVPRAELTPDGLTDPATELLTLMGWPEQLYPTAIRASYAGAGDWKLVWNAVEGRPELVLWGANPGEFATYSPDGRSVCYWYEVIITTGKSSKTYKVRELHQVDDGGTTVTNAAFPMQGANVGNTPASWSAVAGAWDAGQAPPEEKFFEGLTLLPGYRVCNVRAVSDYTISRKNIQWRLILLESARNFSVALTTVPSVVVPPEARNPQTGEILWEKLIFQYRRPGDGSQAQIELKTAVTSLGDSTTVVENLWDNWNAICPISPIFYGKAVASTASGRALDISLQGTINAVKRRRRAYLPATRWALQFGSQLQGYYADQALGQEIAGLSLDFPEVIPEDPTARSGRIRTAKGGGWMSTEEAVREEHPDWTPQQVQEELKRLKDEKDEEAARAAANFTTPAPV